MYIACLVINQYKPHSYWLLISDVLNPWTEDSDGQAVRCTDKRTDRVCVGVRLTHSRTEAQQLLGHMFKPLTPNDF
jgi:hypothetical protein